MIPKINNKFGSEIKTEFFNKIKYQENLVPNIKNRRIKCDTDSLKNFNLIEQFNDGQKIASGISKEVLEAVAKYPKGTFKRVQKTFIDNQGKKHTIAFEGVKVDFDLTTEGLVLQKVKQGL